MGKGNYETPIVKMLKLQSRYDIVTASGMDGFEDDSLGDSFVTN